MTDIRALIADDAYACTFQSLGQYRTALLKALAAEPQYHPDDEAVDRFAAALKEKLARSRAKGRGGWQAASAAHLSQLLRDHLPKGDPVDIGNFAMMLHQNGQAIVADAGACT